jgi:hypothetical protein
LPRILEKSGGGKVTVMTLPWVHMGVGFIGENVLSRNLLQYTGLGMATTER